MNLLLQSGAFRALWLGQSVSAFGDAFRRMAVLLSIYTITGQSGAAIALLAMVEVVPIIALAAAAGALVDRYSKRRVLIAADAIRAALSLMLIPALAAQSSAAVLLLVALSACATVFVEPGTHALVPRVASADDLPKANALLVTGRQIALITGPPLAAVVFYALGPAIALSIDGATYLLSAVALLTLSESAEEGRQVSAAKREHEGLLSEIAAGFAYLRRTPLLIGVALATAGLALAAGLNNTAMIFFISRDLGRDPADIAWLSSSNGLIQVVAGGYLATAARRFNVIHVFVFGAAAMAIGGGVVAFAPALVVLLIGVAITSIGNAPFNIARASLEQSFTAVEYLGRTRSLLTALANVVFLVATALSGYLVDVAAARWVLVISAASLGGMFLAVALQVLPAARAQLRADGVNVAVGSG